MKELFELMNSFEKRNNISITVTFCSDGSSSVNEFWEDDIARFNTINGLMVFLQNVEFERDERGFCISPIKIKVNI